MFKFRCVWLVRALDEYRRLIRVERPVRREHLSLAFDLEWHRGS